MNRPVSWSEAVFVAAVCWTVSGLGYGVLAALDEPQLSMAPLVGIWLVCWFWTRRRSWPTAVVAGLAGAVVLFWLVDLLRPEFDRYVADALSTGTAATVSVVVLTLGGRSMGCRHDAVR
ncbi:hypothetical protein [Streptomyces sp. NBC_00459]|uniref:hypothetical protein n=1 Tax=Streptomyces sp. NBC_00459 TaxID=2975749 RepID=UPI002E16C87C